MKKAIYYYEIYVDGANPNGDPDAENAPRQLPDGRGMITDVCIKSHIVKAMEEKYGYSGVTESKKPIIGAKLFGDMVTKKKGSSIVMAAPVSVMDAVTNEPLLWQRHGITNQHAVDDDGNKSSNSMGSKHRVYGATYRTIIDVDPNRAEVTGLTDDDVENMEIVLAGNHLWQGTNVSTARPAGSIRGVKLWKITPGETELTEGRVYNVLLSGKPTIDDVLATGWQVEVLI